MHRRFIYLLMALISFTVSLCLYGCEEATTIERYGAARIIPEISVDPMVSMPNGIDSIMMADIPDITSMTLGIESADGEYIHSWTPATEYPDTELFRPGEYTVSATYGSKQTEGLNSPYFSGSSLLHLSSGEEVKVHVTAKIVSSVFKLTESSPELLSKYPDAKLIFHTTGYSYIDYPLNQTAPAFLHPGDITALISLTDASGRKAIAEIGRINESNSRTFYPITLKSDGSYVSFYCDGAEGETIRLTEEFFSAKSPEISPVGFTESTPIDITEGTTPDEPIGFSIYGNPEHIILTTSSSTLALNGWPQSIDLTRSDTPTLQKLESMGLKITRGADGKICSVYLTDALANLRDKGSDREVQFSLIASASNGKWSEPATLIINMVPVKISVLSVSDIVIGINTSRLTLICRSGAVDTDLAIEAYDPATTRWSPATINSISQDIPGEYSILFSPPFSTALEQKIRITYCGETVAETILKRVDPEFTFQVDAFAMSAAVKFSASDPKLIPIITDLSKIYVNGRIAFKMPMDSEKGIAMVTGLDPNTTYTLTAAIADHSPGELGALTQVKFTTENMSQIPNYGFDDHETEIDCRNLPSGGRYSQSIIDVFNCQNHYDIKVDKPRSWANTNSKTFCTAATNRNTWYMQPSVISMVDNINDFVAVKLQSVAWDNNGEEIPDYRQKSGQYLPYNPIVPRIKYRAAGKLFLGTYNFNPITMEESYLEGIPFRSRPVTLNGTYHFTPSQADITDRPSVCVEVIGVYEGMEVVLASNRTLLEPVFSFTSFSLPLVYEHFGIKATKIKIMLSSSHHTGSIEYETNHILTLPDPRTATSTGSQFWIRDITLSYI